MGEGGGAGEVPGLRIGCGFLWLLEENLQYFKIQVSRNVQLGHTHGHLTKDRRHVL